ncbi:hypothetical protein CDN99_27560 [Roseateles aquatilis]|uniref:Putative zinc-finger domain-containing protein n=1 Tax=Roseateles aquatilis TaxID=431061 RepID=A0A246IS39_9BURK|nr:hypothetical protein [Roseateles aquatilis]OWQ82971.1 hypothetical protein CDN99_27560 [Roseateles aquatilis]
MTSNDTPRDPAAATTAGSAPDQPNEHRQVWDAIAWVVAGTATPDQRRQVLAHLPRCAHCREELALQQRIHQGMQDPADLPVDESAVQSGLDRLWARDREAGPAMPVAGSRGRAANDGGRLTRWLAAAVAVQAVALCVLGLRVWPDVHPTADYVTLSQPAALPAGAIVRLVPEERVDMVRLRQLLLHHGLRIVGADEDASSLLLAPLNPAAAPSGTALAGQLRDEPGVLLVEPVGAASVER